MTTFLETPRFPEDISYGAEGGPGYSTDIATVYSGHESRNANWSEARARYEAAYGVRTQAQFDTLLAFFRSMKGRAYGFRYKDWQDYKCTVANGRIVIPTGYVPGVSALVKEYFMVTLSDIRPIRKPVLNTVILYRNGNPVSVGSDPGNYSLDYTKGIIGFIPMSTKNITGISKANPGVFSATAHGFTNGDRVGIFDITEGMTEMNHLEGAVTVLSSDTFHLGINTLGMSDYTTGGTARKFDKITDVYTWAGEFDVPVRFDTDELRAVNRGRGANDGLLFAWESIPLVEIRVKL